jgi:hypothetical protein
MDATRTNFFMCLLPMFESEIARGDRRTQQRTKPLKRRGAKATVTGNRN